MTDLGGLGRRGTAAVVWLIAAVLFVSAAAVGTVVVMAWASGVGSPEGPAAPAAGLVFVGWNLLPHAWALALALSAFRSSSRLRAPVIAAGCLILALVDASFLRSFVVSESSTSALIFLTLPLILGAIVGVLQLVVWALRRRSASSVGHP